MVASEDPELTFSMDTIRNPPEKNMSTSRTVALH